MAPSDNLWAFFTWLQVFSSRIIMPSTRCVCNGYDQEQKGLRTMKCLFVECSGNCMRMAPNGGLCVKCREGPKESKRQRTKDNKSIDHFSEKVIMSEGCKLDPETILKLEKALKDNKIKTRTAQIDSVRELFISPSTIQNVNKTHDTFYDIKYDAFSKFSMKDTLVTVINEALKAVAPQFPGFVFGSFSLLYGWYSSGQIYHIDLRSDSFQYAVMITDDSPTTVFSTASMTHQQCCVQLGIPTLNENALVNCSSLLCSLNSIEHSKGSFSDSNVDSGTICVLKGGRVHAGPAFNKFRAVIFFTGTPSTLPPYDPRVQFNIFGMIDHICTYYYHNTKDTTQSMYRKNLFTVFKSFLVTYCCKYPKEQMAHTLSRLNNSYLKNIDLDKYYAILD